MQRLKDIFRTDAFVPGTAIFPEIDAERIASDLDLVNQGRTRGVRGQPEASDDTLDPVEQKIIGRIGELRRKGIENYNTNRRIYDARLGRAADARREVELVAHEAVSNFQAAVKVSGANMATPSARVTAVHRGMQAWRARHQREQPAQTQQPFAVWLSVATILVLVEAVANAGLFAESHDMGFIGGAVIAFMISVVNVGVASLATFFGRNIVHVNWVRKAFGLTVIVGAAGFAVAFNLAVAHFRDALVAGGDMAVASELAMAATIASPLGIESLLSALLVAVGLVVFVIAALKTYGALDPYPGYARQEYEVTRATAIYAQVLDQAVRDLEQGRDDAISLLRDADEEVRIGLGEAIDALYGQTSLDGELDQFLQHCDAKVNLLLCIYRDANRSARAENGADPAANSVPPHFSKPFELPPHKTKPVSEQPKVDAVRQRQEVSELVSQTIRTIFSELKASVSSYPDVADLQGSQDFGHSGHRSRSPGMTRDTTPPTSLRAEASYQPSSQPEATEPHSTLSPKRPRAARERV